MIFLLILVAIILAGILYEYWYSEDYFRTIFRKFSEVINVVFPHILNKLFVKPNGYRFGKDGNRIEYVLAINNRLKTLTPLAIRVVKIFDFFNAGFLDRAIANKKPCT